MVNRACSFKLFKINDDALYVDVEKYSNDYQYESVVRFSYSVLSIGDVLKYLEITV